MGTGWRSVSRFRPAVGAVPVLVYEATSFGAGRTPPRIKPPPRISSARRSRGVDLDLRGRLGAQPGRRSPSTSAWRTHLRTARVRHSASPPRKRWLPGGVVVLALGHQAHRSHPLIGREPAAMYAAPAGRKEAATKPRAVHPGGAGMRVAARCLLGVRGGVPDGIAHAKARAIVWARQRSAECTSGYLWIISGTLLAVRNASSVK